MPRPSGYARTLADQRQRQFVKLGSTFIVIGLLVFSAIVGIIAVALKWALS